MADKLSLGLGVSPEDLPKLPDFTEPELDKPGVFRPPLSVVPEKRPLTDPPSYRPEMLDAVPDKIPYALEQARMSSESRDIYSTHYGAIEFDEVGLGLGVDQPENPVVKSRMPIVGDADDAFVQPDFSIANPEEDTKESSSTFKNVANFMFSDEMGLLGMKWDNEGFSWALDNFYAQLQDHPYATAFTLASYIVPIGAAWSKSAKIAGRALNLAEEAGDPLAAAGKGMFGSKLRYRFNDHARLVKSLAASPSITDGRKLFNEGMAKQIMNASPDEVAKLVPERQLRKMLIGDYHQERWFEMRSLAKSGVLDKMPGLKGAAMRAKYALMKGFTNKYFKVLNDIDAEGIENIDKFYERSKFGTLLGAMPTSLGRENQELAYKYMLGDVTGEEFKKAVGDETFAAVDSLIGRSKDLFKTQADEGFLSDETIALFAEGQGGMDIGYHLPALKRGTPGIEDVGLWAEGVTPGRFGNLVQKARFDPARVLTGPTMKRRGKLRTKEAVREALPELEVDPRKLTVGGYIKDNLIFQVHRGFRDILTAGIKGEPRATHWIKSIDEYEALGDIGKRNFVSIDDLDKVAPGLSDRMRRMLKIELDKTGEGNLLARNLPVIDRDLVEKFFGKEPGSVMWNTGMASRFMELLTTVHKTSRTALNPPTHMSNLLGNMMFLSMAGMNPFSRQSLNDGKMLTGVFSKIAKKHHKNPDITVDQIMTKDNLVKLFGDNRYIKDKAGNRVDLAELFSEEALKDLTEAQAFESVEGLVHTKNLLKHLDSAEQTGFGSGAVKTVARAIAGVGEVPGIKGTLQNMSAAYLGEDMVPKMMYAVHLAREGWGRDAIVREVGRRLPQYRTVGNLPSRARRVVLPWITFPAEAARIVKNNMMDNPVGMMAWMQAPQIAQGITSGAGIGIDFNEYDAAVEAAPPWAVRYQSVFLKEKEATGVLGAVGGAGVGAMAGAALGGAKGALAGAAVGAAGGAAFSTLSPREFTDDNHKEFVRSWSLDFLPQSALSLASYHPHEWEKINPFSEQPTGGREALQTVKDLSPVEPFAVAMPLVELYSGRGSFGREIQAKSGVSFANKLALGLLGFVSPPILQKYGMKLEGPGGMYKFSDVHDVNGGQMTLPRSLTATFGGLAGAGLSFLGGSRGLGLKGAALAAPTALAGTIGAMAGAEVNTRRLMTDLGIMGDPRTGSKGDWTLDFFANSFFGVNKSWRVSPQQAEFNQRLRSKRFEPIRSVGTKQFMDALRNGSQASAKASLGEIYKSYLYEWGDAELATVKTNKWMERHIKMLNKLPVFAGLSEEWLNNRISALASLGPEKSKMHRQQIVELMTELRIRQLNKAKDLRIVR